ncbi:hypothetical protein ACFXO2_32860, partial [Streptomyces sp. NPDC059152]|uniref:hypothetical protein n=1 Tax=Streptomyces sp. NPDC059152 TaxID=3346742 RepID=UPI003678C25A
MGRKTTTSLMAGAVLTALLALTPLSPTGAGPARTAAVNPVPRAAGPGAARRPGPPGGPPGRRGGGGRQPRGRG